MPEETKTTSSLTEDQAVTNFREYLRIKTVHPKPDYGELFIIRKGFMFGHLITKQGLLTN